MDRNRKPGLCNGCRYTVLLYLRPFGYNHNYYCPKLTPCGGSGGPRGSTIVQIEMSTLHSYSTSMHTTDLTGAVCRQYTTRQMTDRQNHRNRSTMLWHRRPNERHRWLPGENIRLRGWQAIRAEFVFIERSILSVDEHKPAFIQFSRSRVKIGDFAVRFPD